MPGVKDLCCKQPQLQNYQTLIPHCYVQGNWEASAMQAQTPQKQIRRNQASSAGLQMQPGLVNPLPEHQQIIFAPLEVALSGTCSWFCRLLKRH
jgi:hypothetical protein